jgi:hypothetical protein
VGQTRRLEEERLHFLRLQLEICCENGYEFEQRRIKRLIRSVEAELESPVSENSRNRQPRFPRTPLLLGNWVNKEQPGWKATSY